MANGERGASYLDSLAPPWEQEEPDIGQHANGQDTNPPDWEIPPQGEQKQAESPPQRLRIHWAELALQEPPERSWAEPGWMGYGHVTLLAGAGGIGKSLVAQQWLSSLVLGRRFLDDSETEPIRMLGWFCEDDRDELWRRQIAISKHLRVGLEKFEDNLIIEPRLGFDNALASDIYGQLMFTPLMKELEAQVNDYKAQVVVLDNIAQLYGGKENDRHQVTAFINKLTGIMRGCAILLLGHPAKMQGSEYSGSTAWEASVRTRLYLGDTLPDEKKQADGLDEEPIDPNVRYLARRKANYSAKDWRRFNFQDGVLIPDEVAVTGGIFDSIRKGNAEKVVLTALARLHTMDVLATESTASPQFLPKLIVQYKLTEGFSRPELAAAMRQLMLDGKIFRAEMGMYSNRTPRFGLKGK